MGGILQHSAQVSALRLRPQQPMYGARARKRGKSWIRKPVTGCVFFRMLCNAHRRERRNGYYEYETRLYPQFAKIANGNVIQVTDVALGLRRVPAGFYTVVHHSGLEWRTENRRSSVNDDVVEWTGPIPMRVSPSPTRISPYRPSDLSATVCLEVYASFEFQPMLGNGEELRRSTITVEQLLDCSEKVVREWDGVLHRVWALILWKHLPFSQKMGILYPRVHPFW